MKTNIHIGLSFLQGNMQLAEIEHGKKETTLVALNEQPTSMDFGHASVTLSPDHPQLETFCDELKDFLKQAKVHSKLISFALPTDPMLISVLPVDAALSPADIKPHLQWELEQHFPNSPAKDYVIDHHPLPGADPATKSMFVVAVHRGIVGFLKNAVTKLKLQLHAIDIDQFSTERSIRFNYPELVKAKPLLIGAKYGRTDISLLVNGEAVEYRSFPRKADQDFKNSIQAFIQYVRDKGILETPTKLVVYGSEFSKDLLGQVQRETGVGVEISSSIRKLSLNKKLPEENLKESYRFAPAIGLALRTPA
ncbi:MAG: hypothetical protein V1799_03310 [bacterium]